MLKKRSIKSRLNEFLFVFICISGFLFSIWRFRVELNQALTKVNETPIATITFKYKTAQRRFWDRVLWDRLQQNSPVYDGDVIRTAPQSEATVYFTDGNIMELYENTLAQLYLKDDGASIDFSQGDISVITSAKGMQIKAGNSLVKIEEGTSVAAGKSLSSQNTDEVFKVLVQSGSVALEAGDTVQNITSGNAVAFSPVGTLLDVPQLSVISPAPNARVLNHTKENLPISFDWVSSENVEKVTLQLAEDTGFSSIVTEVTIDNEKQYTLPVSSGTTWWRLFVGTPEEFTPDTLVESGKLQVLHAPSPELVVPAPGYQIRYRTKQPAIRFIWTENDWATSYQLEIADNSEMNNPVINQRSPQASSIISSLSEGTWYWRVTPFYTILNTGLASPSTVSSFVISKSGDLQAPELLLPVVEGLVNTRNPDTEDSKGTFKPVYFSWKNDPEAVSYTIKIGKASSLDNSNITYETTENFYKLDPSITTLENGLWHWQVVESDVEGNKAFSPIRTFLAIDADIEQRVLFPPDGYRLADSRSQDIRYVWKSNIPADTHFQIAKDLEFTEIVREEKVATTNSNGRYLAPGTYYWRISADIESLQLQTSPRVLYVESPLNKPEVENPPNFGRAVVRPNSAFEMSWQPVSEADYYQIKIFPSGDPEKVVYEQNFIESTSVAIYMQDWKEQQYEWTIQAYREETPLYSRATSYLGQYSFSLKHLRPIDLELPLNAVEIEGIEAIKNPGVVRWSSVDIPENSRFVLYKDSISDNSIVMDFENPPTTIKIPKLYQGMYFWTVEGITFDGLDISSLETRSFSVSPIPMLEAPVLIVPENNEVFQTAYFRTNRSILFKWNQVSGAEEYVFTIFRKETQKNKDAGFLSKLTGKDTEIVEKVMYIDIVDATQNSVEFTDLPLLTRGDFSWSVEARSRYEGALFQNGVIATGNFEIDLPEMTVPLLNNTGDLYGR